jgi:hypothetical protein
MKAKTLSLALAAFAVSAFFAVFPVQAQVFTNATRLRNRPLCNPSAPTSGQALIWNATSGCWGPSAIAGGPAITSTIDLPMGGCNVNSVGVWPAWSTQNAGATFGLGGCDTPALGLGNNGTQYITKAFRWPTNWDTSQPVNVLVTSSGGAGGGNLKFNASFACVTGSANGLSYGSVVSSTTIPDDSNYHNVAFSNVNPSSCTAGVMGVLKLARDQTVSGNSTDSLWIVGAAIQWTSH